MCALGVKATPEEKVGFSNKNSGSNKNQVSESMQEINTDGGGERKSGHYDPLTSFRSTSSSLIY